MAYDQSKGSGSRGSGYSSRGGSYKPYAQRKSFNSDNGQGGFKKEYKPREGGERREYKPYNRDNQGEGGFKKEYKPREGGERREYKPYNRDNQGEGGFKKEYKPREGGERREYKPYNRDNQGEGGFKKEYKPREGGERREYKPYNRDNQGEGGFKKEYKPREGGRNDRPFGRDSKPYGRPSGAGGYGGRPTGPSVPMPQAEPVQQGGEDAEPYLIIGRNAVREAIKSGRSINNIQVVEEQDGSLREIIGMAKDANIVIREIDRRKLDELCMPLGHGGKTGNHQGIAAFAAGVEYCEVSDIIEYAKSRGEEPFIVVLDGIEDPHNLGSIIRSAECAGAHGVVIGKRRSASVSAAAVKASAGATEHMRIARVTNITGTIIELKRAKLWIAGADMEGHPMTKQGLNGALALVIGSEGEGLSKLVKDNCDFLVSIPMFGKLDSLNAGVAAGVLMFEKRRQDAEVTKDKPVAKPVETPVAVEPASIEAEWPELEAFEAEAPSAE